ncbi:MAG: hypothetical protein ACI9FN_001213, partial [Saprospiraceae bacterium]
MASSILTEVDLLFRNKESENIRNEFQIYNNYFAPSAEGR